MYCSLTETPSKFVAIVRFRNRSAISTSWYVKCSSLLPQPNFVEIHTVTDIVDLAHESCSLL